MKKFPFKPRDEGIVFQVGTVEITKKGASRYDWRDPYHLAVTLTWPSFIALLLGVGIVINTIFALFYWIVPGCIANARPGSFLDLFFFSTETIATVGYGVMAPATLYGHIVAAVEIMCGMMVTAILTGVVFARFSRARAKILCAEHAVIARHNGKPTLMIRIANGRLTMLADVGARLNALILERTPEGAIYRHAHELLLTRTRLPIFPATWTIMHVIENASPLVGLTPERLAALEIRLILMIDARDHALGAQVHHLQDYGADKIRFGMRYQDAVLIDANGRTNADLTRLSHIEPDDRAEHHDDLHPTDGLVVTPQQG